MQIEPQSEVTEQARRKTALRRRRQRRTSSWQNRLLPFMIAMVGGLTIFFFWISLNQLESLQQRIERAPELDLAQALQEVESELSLAATDRLLYVQWKTLALLEENALERRYHQANVLLMSRSWIRYLGFITGMILALLGAAFILGKLRESGSDLSLSNAAANVSVKSTSPGLILGVLGTILMLTTIVTNSEIDTRDGPLYTNFMLAPAAASPAQPPPEPLDGQRSETEILSDLEN